MSDRDDIVAATVKYCWALDHQRWDELDQVFAADAVCDYGTDARYVGPQQMGEFFATVVKITGIERSQHVVMNHDIEIDGDTAICRTQNQSHYVMRPHPGSSEPRIQDIGGSYLDRFVRTADGWRISHRVARGTWRLPGVDPREPLAAASVAGTAFVIGGWFDVVPSKRDKVLAAGAELVAATSGVEPGNLDYAFTADPAAKGRVRVYSRWGSEATFRGHMDTEHVKAFRAVLKSVGVKDQQIRRYVVSEETPLLAWALPLEAGV